MNPWLMPDETGYPAEDAANALTNRYGDSNQAIFNGLGSEMGLDQPGVPAVRKVSGYPYKSQDAGDFNPLTGNIHVAPDLSPDLQKATLAHELNHAADAYAAPYPLEGSSHLYFDNQTVPYLNQALRKNAQEERKYNRSQKLPNPWAQFR